MKITQIETIPIRLPTRRVHQWASLTTPIGVYVIIKLYTDEGLIGLGEAPVLKDWEITANTSVRRRKPRSISSTIFSRRRSPAKTHAGSRRCTR